MRRIRNDNSQEIVFDTSGINMDDRPLHPPVADRSQEYLPPEDILRATLQL